MIHIRASKAEIEALPTEMFERADVIEVVDALGHVRAVKHRFRTIPHTTSSIRDRNALAEAFTAGSSFEKLVACPKGNGEPCEPEPYGDGTFARCPKCGDDTFPVIDPDFDESLRHEPGCSSRKAKGLPCDCDRPPNGLIPFDLLASNAEPMANAEPMERKRIRFQIGQAIQALRRAAAKMGKSFVVKVSPTEIETFDAQGFRHTWSALAPDPDGNPVESYAPTRAARVIFPSPRYVIGVDTGKGNDRTVISVVRDDKLVEVRLLVGGCPRCTNGFIRCHDPECRTCAEDLDPYCPNATRCPDCNAPDPDPHG